MPRPQLVVPQPAPTPAEPRTSGGRARSLPPDLLREASLRLSIMSLVAAGLWAFGTLFGHIAFRAGSGGGEYYIQPLIMPADAISAAGFVVSIALFFYARRSRRDPAVILDIGLVYMVLMALGIGLMFHLSLATTGQTLASAVVRPEVSWLGAMVLIFAAILPTSPRKMFVAALVSVSMNPLGMLIAKAEGVWDFGPAPNVLLMHYPDFLLAGVAVVISSVLTKLGRQVARARELGSYQLGDLIGRGGMGEVFRATHRMLARPAAIKLIRSDMLGDVDEDSARLAIKRFCREAESAANLRSPHSVEVYDFGVTDDETFYLVMEMLDGLDLETMVKRYGPLPPARVVHILLQVCESLEEAHQRGLVHRDIKPANIHVGRVGTRHDFVKVLDFGLAKPAGAAAHDGDSLETAAGITPGTPAYMAPEMLSGDVDGRADLYALGCVAYYLLTGKLVFEGGNAMQTIIQHATAEPTPPSARAEQAIPPALDRIVLACLAKEPNERMPSAARLATALAKVELQPWGEELAAGWWSDTLRWELDVQRA